MLESEKLTNFILLLLDRNPMMDLEQICEKLHDIPELTQVQKGDIAQVLFISEQIGWTIASQKRVYFVKAPDMPETQINANVQNSQITEYSLKESGVPDEEPINFNPNVEQSLDLQVTNDENQTEEVDNDQHDLLDDDLSDTERQDREKLAEEVAAVIKNDPMSLKQIKEVLHVSEKYSSTSYRDILNAIRESKQIKRSYALGVESYYLQREPELSFIN